MLAFLSLWGANLVLTVLFMTHRGHSWFPWALLAGVLGPLVWPLAAREVRADRRSADQLPPTGGEVLIAVAPWAGSAHPDARTVRRVGPPVRGATFVSVLDAEDAGTPAGRAAAEEAEAGLTHRCRDLVSAGLIEGPVERLILYGRPGDEIARLAASGEFRAIVLGGCGSIGHHLLHGCTRARLERRTSVPIVTPERPEEVVA